MEPQLIIQHIDSHMLVLGFLLLASVEELKVNGVDLGEINAELLQKIEELTLHLIEKDKLSIPVNYILDLLRVLPQIYILTFIKLTTPLCFQIHSNSDNLRIC